LSDEPTLTYLELRIRAREQIKSGRIPSVVPSALSAGYGSCLNTCVLCGLSIGPAQVEYEVCVTGQPCNFHVACYAAWRDECLRRSGGNGSREPPLSGFADLRFAEPLKPARRRFPGLTGNRPMLRVIVSK
jgi:hypothetical protein